jgi:RNA polymerase sigma-70 factor (ECF subfamily)
MESVEAKLDLGSIYAKHASFVRRTLAKRGVREQDLDDVVQEAFVTIHRLLPTFEGRSSIETWLYSVSWRVAAAHHRRSRRRNEEATVSAERDLVDAPVRVSPDRGFHVALAQLEEPNRDVIALHEVAGLSISEVSELTGNARATIRDRLDHGRRALGRQLWRSFTAVDDAAWLDQLAPRSAARIAQLDRSSSQFVVCGDDAVISVLDDLVLVLWRGISSVAALEALIEVMFASIVRYPDGIRYLSVIEPSSTPPTREGRQLTAWGFGKMGHKLRAAGWVVENLGMKSLVASLVNACLFVGGVPVNIRVFDDVPRAAHWLTEYGGAQESEQISAHVEAMRRQLTPARPV